MSTKIYQSLFAFLLVLCLASHAAAVPTADDASFQVPAGGLVSGDLSLLISGFTDPNFGASAPAAHGTVTIGTLTGAFSYSPNAGYTGPDQFTYRASEASSPQVFDTGIISINVCPAGTCIAGPVLPPGGTVPEPSSVVLLLLGIAGLAAKLRARRQ
jgi:Bacterial Ig domain/PEP-CTERM motif